MLVLLWLTSKLFITPFKILEGYVMESKLHCPLFHSQMQETQVGPTCLLEKKPHQNSGLQNLILCAPKSELHTWVLFSYMLANVGVP